MADRQRKTYDYREATDRFRRAGMPEAAADSVAKEFDTVLTEHTVSRDEHDRLTDKVDELIALVKGMDERLRKVETGIHDLEKAILEGDMKAIKWIISTVVAICALFGSLSAGFSYLFYSAAIG